MKHAQTFMNTCPTADGLQFMPPFGASNPLDAANCTTKRASRASGRGKTALQDTQKPAEEAQPA